LFVQPFQAGNLPESQITSAAASFVTRLLTAVGFTIVLLLAIPSCGEDTPEITIEDRLERIAGVELTPAQIQRQLDVADTLCQSELQILERMWSSMSASQMRFQDYVFAEHCVERSVEYATATGRALTVEAHNALTQDTSSTTLGTTAPTSQTLPLPNSSDSTTTSTQP